MAEMEAAQSLKGVWLENSQEKIEAQHQEAPDLVSKPVLLQLHVAGLAFFPKPDA